MKKIFSFLCLIVAVTAMTSCSSAKEEKGTSGTGNVVLDNIFERKSVNLWWYPIVPNWIQWQLHFLMPKC